MNTRMNLTALADLANAQLASKGRPLMLALDDILPDPDNPRDVDADDSAAAVEAQEQLDADVAARGVKTPISVRAHPSVPRKYIINYGHRRYRSACRNKLLEIPAFVDEKFDSYDQVNENELHMRLTTRARALFIKGRLDAGDSKGEIAERMRKKNQAFITEHLALIDGPPCVNEAYAAGVTSARTLYDLRQAWDEFPAEIDAWCRSGVAISRDGIREALGRFRHDEAGATTSGNVRSEELRETDFRHDEKSSSGSGGASLTNSAPAIKHQMPRRADAGARQIRTSAGGEKGGTLRASDGALAARSTAKGTVIDGLVVQYKSELARVAQDVVVPIVLDCSGETLHVRLSELVFEV